jgi:hypothetical protein
MKIEISEGVEVDVNTARLGPDHLRYLEAIDGRDGKEIVRLAEGGQYAARELVRRLVEGPGLPTAADGMVQRDRQVVEHE